jgi:hypothetical protein
MRVLRLVATQLIVITTQDDPRGPQGSIIKEETFHDTAERDYFTRESRMSHDCALYLNDCQKSFIRYLAGERLKNGEIGQPYYEMIVGYCKII